MTMAMLMNRLITGDMGALNENLGSLSSSTASKANISPSVAIYHNDYSVHLGNFDVDIAVDGAASPNATAAAIGSSIAANIRQAIQRDNGKAARNLISPVER